MIRTVGVSFVEHGRIYYFAALDFDLSLGDKVVVETEKGLQYGIVMTSIREVEEKDLGLLLKNVIRLANQEDHNKHRKNLKDAEKALLDARRFAEKLNLPMRILDAQFTFDRNQLLFNFVTDGRIDFRELAKKLAQVYHTRIELRQIGVRDKAKEIGGLGPCGRFLCCNTFLTDFNSVSINMAKNQYIALNPTKINGVCGRLLCCLKYEDELYTELKKEFPAIGAYYDTPSGRGRVVEVNVFQRKITVEMKDHTRVLVELEKTDGSLT